MADGVTAVVNRPVWVDLSSSDPEASRAFYSKLLGWQVEVNPDPQYGGYALAREAREISAYEVIHAIDGPFFITSCTKGKTGCELGSSCTIKEPLARVNETIAGVLKSISIQDLAEHERPPSRSGAAQGLVELAL